MGEGRDATQDAAQDKVTVQEAARRLGVKEDAIRKRIQRRSIRYDKAEDGRVYVWVDATQDTGRTTQDTTQDAAQDERFEGLREQIGYLRRQLDEEREARRRADTIIAQLARANEEQARTIRELEAPQEASEAAETVEEGPDRAESHSATEGAQEGTERPQERHGWLRPVDKLPWWHYVLGLALVAAVALLFPRFSFDSPLRPGPIAGGVFGFWVGLRRSHLRYRTQVIPLGVLVGLAVVLGTTANYSVQHFVHLYERYPGGLFIAALLGFMSATFIPGWLLFVSGAVLGRAWQRHRAESSFGTTPATPASGPNPASPASRTPGWTPRQQAILGFAGTIIAALISFMGTIFGVILASGS